MYRVACVHLFLAALGPAASLSEPAQAQAGSLCPPEALLEQLRVEAEQGPKGKPDVDVWLFRQTGANWQACLALASCLWHTSDAADKLPLPLEYTPTGYSNPFCETRLTEERTMKVSCAPSPELRIAFASAAELVRSDFAGSCSSVQTIHQLDSPTGPLTGLPIPLGSGCVMVLIRSTDGAMALSLRPEADCSGHDAAGAAIAPMLEPGRMPVVTGNRDYSALIALDITAMGKAKGVVVHGLDSGYIATWLEAIDALAAAPTVLERFEDDPLNGLSSGTPLAVVLHFLTAASARLHEATGQTATVSAERAQAALNWMSAVALSQGLAHRAVFFQAELALR